MKPKFPGGCLLFSFTAAISLLTLPVCAQMVIGGSTPAPSAVLDLQSTSKGFLPPRMTTAQRNAIASPATGLIVYNSDEQTLQINLGTSATPTWARLSVSQSLSSLIPPLTALTGGTFTMGCTTGDPDCILHESPQHSVTLSPFQISDSEVTQAQWQAVMGSNPSHFNSPACPQCPVEKVSWYDALVYCNRLSDAQGLTPCYYQDASYTQVYGKSGGTWSLPNTAPVYWNPSAKGYRLPTEAEWEYAARGGSALNIYSGSGTVDQVAWYTGNSTRTKAVKELFPNSFGLYDMSGNVEEWCWDFYSATYYYISPSTDPTGPSGGGNQVIRGGGYLSSAANNRVSYRGFVSTASRSSDYGFRIAR